MRASGGLRELKKDIAASLYMEPATFEELVQREFLINRAEFGISLLLNQMEIDKWIYMRGEVYHTYKKFAESPEMSEYELYGIR